MDCHCKDHLHMRGQPHACDCASHEFPTYSFVVTRVMEDDPGMGTVYVSKTFMETLQLQEGDPVEIAGAGGCVVQARSHPNPWVDTRMVSLDKGTMGKIGCRLFGEIKLRKTVCSEAHCVRLSVPDGVNVTRLQLQAMLAMVEKAVVTGGDRLNLTTSRGDKVEFGIVACQPEGVCSISPRTRIELVRHDGSEYVAKKETTFKDVGGLEDAVRQVREVVQLPLRHPEIFRHLGMDPPRGVLLYGPSGTGKTLIARAVAGETGCYFKAVSGTEIMDKYYGESEAKLRAAFDEAAKCAPAIIFIDEIDALAPRRDTAEGEVERRVTAQLLALMDGLEDRGDVIVLAATNLQNVLDDALRRPGRFDREVLIGVPDTAGREEILRIHTADMPLGEVDLRALARKTHGFVGADIKALCQEAAYKALQRILPGLEDTEEKLTEDFLQAIKVETQDFLEAFRQMRPSSARTFEVDLSEAGWDKIAGYAAEIEFLEDTVLWPLKHVAFLSGIGVQHLGGLLITGPPGVGKTLMARSLGKESGFNVIEIRGPELISKYMGESERNIRELFRRAREMAPTVVILDGVDAMTSGGWSDSKVIDRVVNQLVTEMNALGREKPVLVVAVTNRATDLPPSLRSTGRFSIELPLRLPDERDREALIRKYLSGDRIRFEGDPASVATQSAGLTGGDIREICRRVVLKSARESLEQGDDTSADVRVSENDVLKLLDRWKLTEAAVSAR